MARGVNKVMLIGNLGADPEIRHTSSGISVAHVNLATSESWIDKTTGDRQERTEWHRLVLWRQLAEIAEKYLKKGSKVYIEGKLQTRSWDGADGQKRYSTEVVVDDLQMLEGRDGERRVAPFDDPGPMEPPPEHRDPSQDDDLPF